MIPARSDLSLVLVYIVSNIGYQRTQADERADDK